MSIFDSIKHAIFGDKGVMGSSIGASHPQGSTPAPAAPATAQTPVAAPAASAPVDVEAILTQKAAAYGKPNNWRTSIVDLMTLLGMDSSLAARKELANELNIHVGADGTMRTRWPRARLSKPKAPSRMLKAVSKAPLATRSR